MEIIQGMTIRFFVFFCYFFNHIFLSQRLLSIFLNTAFYFTKITKDKMFFQTKSKSAESSLELFFHQREFCGILGRASSSNRLVDSVQAAIPRGALRGGVCVLCKVCRSVYSRIRGRQGARGEVRDHCGCVWTSRADNLDV